MAGVASNGSDLLTMMIDDAVKITPVFEQAVGSANRQGRPLYLIVLATKPCYIKLASLIFALKHSEIPFLLVDAGQHYQPVLVNVRQEFRYRHLIGVYLSIRGDLIQRTADLGHKLKWLNDELRSARLREPAIPVVSGDTSTAAFMPIFWYLVTGLKSVHVEAGLRSFGPETEWAWQGLAHLIGQRQRRWSRFRGEPFPEAIDTILASTTSDLMLAPVNRNSENLIHEGYHPSTIHLVGSLSADAVDLAITHDLENTRERMLDRIPDGKWLRVDLHRRENMSFAKVKAILEGLGRFSESGGRVLLVNTNAFRAAVTEHNLVDLLRTIERKSGVLVHEMWPSYLDVIAFLQSDRCLALYTDSGGLQEEANVLGVPCITCRYSTDRPETVLDGLTNILLPPANETLVCNGLEALLSAPAHEVWPGLKSNFLYSKQVGQRIAQLLSEYVPPPPVDGAGVDF